MLNYPKISGKLPGPKAKKVVKEVEKYLSPSYTWVYPLVIRRGRGAVVEDVDGNLFLDFTAGIAVCATGHSHPKVVKAIENQAEHFLHMSGTDFYYQSQAELARQLGRLVPGDKDKKVFFTNSGAEAIEGALKLARYHTGRKRIIAFLGGFHGRTLGALSVTASKAIQRKGHFPLVPGVTHAAYAYCYRCPYNLTPNRCSMYCVDWIEKQLFTTIVPPEEVAAVVVEPMQGEGGYVVPPKAFHQRLKALCEKYGILYVADEIQTGMGRTGRMFASEHFGIVPDILCLAKGIASGMPLGAFIADARIMNWPRGSHATTFGGNPVSLAAALATLHLLEGGLVANAEAMGDYLKGELVKRMDKYTLIGDVRGLGLMVGVELVKGKKGKEYATEERNKVVRRCFEKGLLLLGCGANVIRFIPPLIISKEEVDTALEIFDGVLSGVEGGG